MTSAAAATAPRNGVQRRRVVNGASTQGGGGGARRVDGWWWRCELGVGCQGGGRARESAAFSDARSGRRPQGWPTESKRVSHAFRESDTGVSRRLNGRFREQLDRGWEEEEFALFADTLNASVGIFTASNEHSRIRESARLRAGRRHGPTLRVGQLHLARYSFRYQNHVVIQEPTTARRNAAQRHGRGGCFPVEPWRSQQRLAVGPLGQSFLDVTSCNLSRVALIIFVYHVHYLVQGRDQIRESIMFLDGPNHNGRTHCQTVCPYKPRTRVNFHANLR